MPEKARWDSTYPLSPEEPWIEPCAYQHVRRKSAGSVRIIQRRGSPFILLLPFLRDYLLYIYLVVYRQRQPIMFPFYSTDIVSNKHSCPFYHAGTCKSFGSDDASRIIISNPSLGSNNESTPGVMDTDVFSSVVDVAVV